MKAVAASDYLKDLLGCEVDLICRHPGIIHQLQEWNATIKDADELLISPGGMKTLAADCMLLQALCEGI